ncbi:Reverse transcriptase zinc-binding domain [Sesbania bispinosa]|nr:Reverse transcriptase zinc-binding domain [Sesbania bispinosa]
MKGLVSRMLRNAALGQENGKGEDGLFPEEEDNLARSTKKAKVYDLEGESQETLVMETTFSQNEVIGEEEAEPARRNSNEVNMAEADIHKQRREDDEDDSASETESSEGEAGLGIEVDHSNPLCPEITISGKECKRACKPWRNFVIVKVLEKTSSGDDVPMAHGDKVPDQKGNAAGQEEDEEKDCGVEMQSEVQVNPQIEEEVQVGKVDKSAGEGPKSFTKLRAMARQSIGPDPTTNIEAHSLVQQEDQQKDQMVQYESSRDMSPNCHLRSPIAHLRNPGFQPKPTTPSNLVVDLEVCNHRPPDGTSSRNQDSPCVPSESGPPLKGKEAIMSVIKTGNVKGIRYVWNFIDQGWRWNIGQGISVKLWLDPWMHPGVKLKDLVVQTIPSHLINDTVVDMCLEDGAWDFFKFSHLLLPEVVYDIQGRMGSHAALGDDIPIWDLNQNGSFSVKLAYKLVNEDIGEDHRCWRLIWNLDIPQRTKVFLWLLLKGGLRTNSYLSDIGICPSSTCDRCQHHPETPIHALRECQFAKDVWSNLDVVKFNPAFFTMDLGQWIISNLEKKTTWRDNLAWGSTFSIVIWLIWLDRNECLFSHENGFAGGLWWVLQGFLRNMAIREANRSGDALAKLALHHPMGLYLLNHPL